MANNEITYTAQNLESRETAVKLLVELKKKALTMTRKTEIQVICGRTCIIERFSVK